MAQPSMTRRPVAGPTAGQPRVPRLQAPPGLQLKDGQIGVAISRPTQVPQWPLPGPLTSLSGPSDSEPYRPPPGKSTQAPQRPPRPSRVPSMLDGSKIQDPTPSFQYRPQSGRESSGQELASVPETPSSLSRPSTVSSVGSIPDFPLPIPIPVAPPPRRSVNLGPPPSARRGASSFYSNASFVSPIPEESPRSRSHVSFASSAAMPESWGTPSPGPSPNYPEPSYEDIIADQTAGGSVYEDDAEESQLVRSASVGKRGKPTLVSTTTPRAFENGESSQRPAPTPIQSDPFKNGTGYVENSSSSSGTLPMSRAPVPRAITTDSMLDAYNAASATDPSNPPTATPSPQPRGARPYSRRLSAIWRGPPPQSDPDIPPRTESRASLTSLPDLIRRATRLAATLEMGRRPASRFDDLTDSSGADLFGRYDKELSGKPFPRSPCDDINSDFILQSTARNINPVYRICWLPSHPRASLGAAAAFGRAYGNKLPPGLCPLMLIIVGEATTPPKRMFQAPEPTRKRTSAGGSAALRCCDSSFSSSLL